MTAPVDDDWKGDRVDLTACVAESLSYRGSGTVWGEDSVPEQAHELHQTPKR
jgi:hypothetical protein